MAVKFLKDAKQAAPAQKTEPNVESIKKKTRRKRGTGEMVAMIVRLSKDQWMKLQLFAMSQGESLQSLAIEGFNELLVKKGQSKL